MNADVKKFLKIYFALAIVIWVVLVVLMGPPGLSGEYRKAYKAEHDRYLTITKSVPFRRWEQRPHLNTPGENGVPASLAQDIAFVETYRSRPEFQKEARRIYWFTFALQGFNAFMVVWLMVHFGKKPVLNLIDGKIQELSEKIAAVRNARDAAAERKNAAKKKLENKDSEEARILEESEQRLKNEIEALNEAQRLRLEIMERELEDRKMEEIHSAAMRLKADIVNRAVDEALQRFKQTADASLQARLVDEFTADLETRPA